MHGKCFLVNGIYLCNSGFIYSENICIVKYFTDTLSVDLVRKSNILLLFWILINSIDFISFFPINSNPLTPSIQAFCNGIGEYNLMPNPLQYVFNVNDTSPPYSEATNLGFNTSVFSINMGQNCAIFLGLVALWPFVYIISKIKIGKIDVSFKKILQNYKYGMFLRFWIQSYLDIGFYSLIHLRSVRLT